MPANVADASAALALAAQQPEMSDEESCAEAAISVTAQQLGISDEEGRAEATMSLTAQQPGMIGSASKTVQRKASMVLLCLSIDGALLMSYH